MMHLLAAFLTYVYADASPYNQLGLCEFCDSAQWRSLGGCLSDNYAYVRSSMLSKFQVEDIFSAIKKIKAKDVSRPNNISVFLLTDYIHCFLNPLLGHTFNFILFTSVYTKVWKFSHIILVFKSADRACV